MLTRLFILCVFIFSIEQIEAGKASTTHTFVTAVDGAAQTSFGPYFLKADKLLNEWGTEKLPQHFAKVFPGQALDFAFIHEEKFKKDLLPAPTEFLSDAQLQEYRNNVENLNTSIRNLASLMNGESDQNQKDLYFRDLELAQYIQKVYLNRLHQEMEKLAKLMKKARTNTTEL